MANLDTPLKRASGIGLESQYPQYIPNSGGVSALPERATLLQLYAFGDAAVDTGAETRAGIIAMCSGLAPLYLPQGAVSTATLRAQVLGLYPAGTFDDGEGEAPYHPYLDRYRRLAGLLDMLDSGGCGRGRGRR